MAEACAIIMAAVVTSAVARFGLLRTRECAAAAGAITFVLCIANTLQDLSEPDMLANSVLIALLAAGATVATCHALHDVAHQARRFAFQQTNHGP